MWSFLFLSGGLLCLSPFELTILSSFSFSLSPTCNFNTTTDTRQKWLTFMCAHSSWLAELGAYTYVQRRNERFVYFV